MSKKIDKETKAILEDLELPPLPETVSLGSYDPEALSFRDKTGRMIQGPGVPMGRYGIVCRAIPKDTPKDAADRQRSRFRAQGWAMVEGDKIVCLGLNGAEIWYTSFERYLQIQAAKTPKKTQKGEHVSQSGARTDTTTVISTPSDPDK